MKKTVWRVALLVGIGFVAGVYLTGLVRGRPERPEPGPPILQKVQAIGELHTARYEYQNVFEHETALEPVEWARYLPGATNLVHSATRNRALMNIKGTVEAGVNLAGAKAEHPVPGRTVLVLPRAKVYEPQVRGNVFDTKSGTFWRDENLALDALEDAKRRLKFAAIEQGIGKKAEEEAAKRVRALLVEIGAKNVEVIFK